MSFGDNSFIPTCVPTQNQAREGVRAHKGSDPYKKNKTFLQCAKIQKDLYTANVCKKIKLILFFM
jgi:hypothetical protein